MQNSLNCWLYLTYKWKVRSLHNIFKILYTPDRSPRKYRFTKDLRPILGHWRSKKTIHSSFFPNSCSNFTLLNASTHRIPTMTTFFVRSTHHRPTMTTLEIRNTDRTSTTTTFQNWKYSSTRVDDFSGISENKLTVVDQSKGSPENKFPSVELHKTIVNV